MSLVTRCLALRRSLIPDCPNSIIKLGLTSVRRHEAHWYSTQCAEKLRRFGL